MNTPKYTQPDVLRATGLNAALLQTRTNRNQIKIGNPNPGRGRSRLYGAIDVVAVAIIRRVCDDMGVRLSTGLKLANVVADELRRNGKVDWDLYAVIRRRASNAPEIILSSGASDLVRQGFERFDAWDKPVAHFTEDGLHFLRRARTLDEGRPIDPERRDALARIGQHAEPVLIVPVGEIANGVLLQLAEFDKSRAA